MTTYIIISIVILLAISIYVYNRHEDKEMKIRKSDKLLSEYHYEAYNQRNDGWTMKHYQELYKKRLKELKNETNSN